MAENPYVLTGVTSLREIDTPNSAKPTHLVVADKERKIWLEKEARDEDDALNEATGHFLFTGYPVNIIAPEVRFSGEQGKYYVGFIPNIGCPIIKLEHDFYEEVRKVPQRYSALLHIINDDYDRVRANYLFTPDKELVVIDQAGGWQGFGVFEHGPPLRYLGRELPKDLPEQANVYRIGETPTALGWGTSGAIILETEKPTFATGGFWIFTSNNFIRPLDDSLEEFLEATRRIQRTFDHRKYKDFLDSLPITPEQRERKLERLVKNTTHLGNAIKIIFEVHRTAKRNDLRANEVPKGLSFWE